MLIIMAVLGGIFFYTLTPTSSSSERARLAAVEEAQAAAIASNRDRLDRRDALDKARDKFVPGWELRKSCNDWIMAAGLPVSLGKTNHMTAAVAYHVPEAHMGFYSKDMSDEWTYRNLFRNMKTLIQSKRPGIYLDLFISDPTSPVPALADADPTPSKFYDVCLNWPGACVRVDLGKRGHGTAVRAREGRGCLGVTAPGASDYNAQTSGVVPSGLHTRLVRRVAGRVVAALGTRRRVDLLHVRTNEAALSGNGGGGGGGSSAPRRDWQLDLLSEMLAVNATDGRVHRHRTIKADVVVVERIHKKAAAALAQATGLVFRGVTAAYPPPETSVFSSAVFTRRGSIWDKGCDWDAWRPGPHERAIGDFLGPHKAYPMLDCTLRQVVEFEGSNEIELLAKAAEARAVKDRIMQDESLF